jgi:hypothetical protein
MQPAAKPISEAALERALRISVCLWLAAFFFACVSAPQADLDMWHEIGLIRESLKAGHLLTRDVFAYTPTVTPAVDHEWGAGAILYFLTFGIGSWSIVAFKYVLALATAVFALQCAHLRGAAFPTLSVLAPLAMWIFSLGCATLRAQAYTYLFLAALLWFLDLDRLGRRIWIPFWIGLFVLWANLHGGCIVGLVVLLIYWAEQVLRRRPHAHLPGVLLMTVAALAVNPFGLAYYRHMWNTLQMPRPELPEWWPIWRFGVSWQVLFAITVALAVYAIAVRGLRTSYGVLVLAAMAAGSAIHVRMLPLYAVVWVSYVPAYLSGSPLDRLLDRLFRKRQLVTAVASSLAVACCLLLVQIGFWRLTVPDDVYPIGAVKYLREQGFRGNLMAPFELGAFVSWRLFPAVKVSVDSRYDIAYPPALVNEHFAFFAARPGWQEMLTRYPADLVLTPRKRPIAKQLWRTNWKCVYQDRWFKIYARPGVHLPFVDESNQVFPSTFP